MIYAQHAGATNVAPSAATIVLMLLQMVLQDVRSTLRCFFTATVLLLSVVVVTIAGIALLLLCYICGSCIRTPGFLKKQPAPMGFI
jgi:nucleoside recognition membrane protein YjiH